MRYEVKLLPVALFDLRKAKKWYNDQKEDLGGQFKLEVDDRIVHLGNNPKRYPFKYKTIRQLILSKFPYAIYYTVEDEKKRVVVYGILHTKRNPTIIQKRNRQ